MQKGKTLNKKFNEYTNKMNKIFIILTITDDQNIVK